MAQVLDERVPPCQRIGRGRLFESTHRVQSLFEVPVVPLDPVVEVFRAPMLHIRKDPTQRRWVALGLIRRDPRGRNSRFRDRPLEERLRRIGVASLAEVGIHHLTLLIDRAINLRPATT